MPETSEDNKSKQMQVLSEDEKKERIILLRKLLKGKRIEIIIRSQTDFILKIRSGLFVIINIIK